MRETRQSKFLERKTYTSSPYHPVAQRKFASNSPPISPSKSHGNSNKLIKRDGEEQSDSAEDFLDFLCLRHHPYLPGQLEHFADLRNNAPLIEESESESELFNYDSDFASSESSAFTGIEKFTSRNNLSLGKMKDVTKCHVTYKEMKNIFEYVMQKSSNAETSLLFWVSPEWKVEEYILKNLKFDVTLKHIHRLKNPLNENFITLQCIQRQLNKESKSVTRIPYLGCNELDLVRLHGIVTAYGGIETVNDTQSWKCIADQIGLSNEYPGRVVKLEEHYLRYVIPFSNLSESDKEKLRFEVLQDSNSLIDCNYTKRKSLSWRSFLRLSNNLKNGYVNENLSSDQIENSFWDIVEKADRHVVGACGEVLVTDEVFQFSAMKGKAWNFKNIFTHEGSALKYLSQYEEVVQPTIIFSSVYAVSEWFHAPHHFHILSYIHYGADKVWYVVPSNHTDRVHNLIQKNPSVLCKPQELIQNGIHVERFIQREGDYVVIKPNSYYLNISTGYSFSEQVFLAPIVWFCSPYLRNFKFQVNDYVIANIIISTSRALSKKKCDIDIVRILIEKLNQLYDFLQEILEKFQKYSLTNIFVIPTSEVAGRICSKCFAACSFVSIRQLTSKSSILCIEDCLKVLSYKSNKKIVDSMLIECFTTPNEIEGLKMKLESKFEDSQ